MFLLERLISLIAPHLCLGCGVEGAVVCAWCLPEFAMPIPERCYRCKVQTAHSLVCRPCRRESRLKHVWVRTSYDGAVKQLIYDFKFARKQAAAQTIATLITTCLPFLPTNTIITHVPTASSRIRQRGYDHAELLAKALAQELGLRHLALLRREGQTRQVGAKRSQRLVQLKDAFRLNKSIPLNAPILLVDDLVTTGGTLEAAARCLKQAGVKTVSAVAFAQKE